MCKKGCPVAGRQGERRGGDGWGAGGRGGGRGAKGGGNGGSASEECEESDEYSSDESFDKARLIGGSATATLAALRAGGKEREEAWEATWRYYGGGEG